MSDTAKDDCTGCHPKEYAQKKKLKDKPSKLFLFNVELAQQSFARFV